MFNKQKIKKIEIQKKPVNNTESFLFIGTDKERYIIRTENEAIGNIYTLHVYKEKDEMKLFCWLNYEKTVNGLWKLANIEVKNSKRIGIGTALMKVFFEILDENNITSAEGNFAPLMKPEDAKAFYDSFNNHKTSKHTIVKIDYEYEQGVERKAINIKKIKITLNKI